MLNQNEIWKPYINKDFNYEISSLGKVRNTKTKHELKFFKNNSGYYCIKLTNNNHKPVHFLVHRLVAETFLKIPNDIENIVVNHKDGNKLNNNVENLEWVSQSYNCKYAFKLTPEIKERCKSYIGKKHARSRCPYHNVSMNYKYHTSRITGLKYLSSINFTAKVVHNGIILDKKSFKNPEDAAEHVNNIIDKYNLDRPKNLIDRNNPFIYSVNA